MVEGLWTVEFMTQGNRYGRGVIVLNEGRILGGDNGYYYSGTYQVVENRIQATANIIRYSLQSISVFGSVDVIQLEFSGQIDDNQFSGSGNIAGDPTLQIRIVGKKKEDW